MTATPAQTATQKRVALVLNRLAAMAANDEDDATMISESLDEMLDDIHGGDGFGTEGQSDPRGDGRNGTWSMNRVEGFDI